MKSVRLNLAAPEPGLRVRARRIGRTYLVEQVERHWKSKSVVCIRLRSDRGAARNISIYAWTTAFELLPEQTAV